MDDRRHVGRHEDGQGHRPGSNGISTPTRSHAFDGDVYFGAGDGTHGYELWKSDGTAGGTKLVKDIYAGPKSSIPVPQVVMGSDLYLVAQNAASGMQVWKTDGTAAGTVQVSDIDPGPNALIYPAGPIVTMGGKIYFGAFDAGHGIELWRNSGSMGTGLLLKDIWPGSSGSQPNGLRVVGSTLLFTAFEPTHGTELWRTDGTQVRDEARQGSARRVGVIRCDGRAPTGRCRAAVGQRRRGRPALQVHPVGRGHVRTFSTCRRRRSRWP